MQYCYYDLGEEQEDRWAVLRMRGTSANVILLDPLNFYRYRKGQPAFYAIGGYCRRSPVRLQIPKGEHWYLVIDHGGFAGRVRAELEVLAADELRTAPEDETTSVGSTA
jgi:Domain of unknown function (DUF1883)